MSIIKKIRKKVFFFLTFIFEFRRGFNKPKPHPDLKNLLNTLNNQMLNSYFTQALITIKNIVKIEPNNPKFQLQFIQLLQKNLFYQKAFQLIEKSKKKYPSKYYLFQLEQAKLLQRTNHNRKALVTYQNLAKLYPLKTELLANIKNLETNIPDVQLASATGQLKKIKNKQIEKAQNKIHILKLQNILFKEESPL